MIRARIHIGGDLALEIKHPMTKCFPNGRYLRIWE
jgi:hypothetical protein